MVQINNGVYKSGFSTTQAAYDRAQAGLYSALDQVAISSVVKLQGTLVWTLHLESKREFS